MTIEATLFSDPACPWAYSATPALTALRWRYGDQLRWRLVTIGLRDAVDPDAPGPPPAARAAGQRRFRDRYGMPFALDPRPRPIATGRACRAIVAVRLRHPGSELEALRRLAFAWHTSTALLDEDDALEAALAAQPGIDAAAVIAALDDEDVLAAYSADREEARSAAGGPTEFQGKAARSDGLVRYTAPSLILGEQEGRRLKAGGFQSLEVYDALVANLDTSLQRTPPPADPLALLSISARGSARRRSQRC